MVAAAFARKSACDDPAAVKAKEEAIQEALDPEPAPRPDRFVEGEQWAKEQGGATFPVPLNKESDDSGSPDS